MENKNVRAIISVILNIILISAAVFLIFTVSSKGFALGANIFDERSVDTSLTARDVEVVIPEKVTAEKLADILFEKGLISDKFVFKIQVQLSDYKGKFIAGTYTLKTDMQPTQIMEKLCTEAETESETEEKDT